MGELRHKLTGTLRVGVIDNTASAPQFPLHRAIEHLFAVGATRCSRCHESAFYLAMRSAPTLRNIVKVFIDDLDKALGIETSVK